MEYIYAALTIHKAGGKIDEASVKKVLEAAGATPDDTRVKALVAALDGVDINDAVSRAAAAPARLVQVVIMIRVRQIERIRLVHDPRR